MKHEADPEKYWKKVAEKAEKKRLKENRSQDALDSAIGRHYGGPIVHMANRRLLSLKVTGRYILFNSYRKLLMAMIIIGLYKFPIMQLNLCMIL